MWRRDCVIFTKVEKVLANRQITQSNLESCNHEKGDTRLFVYTWDADLNIMQKVTIIGEYNYIVVIALYIFSDLKLDQFWIEYGCRKNRRCLPIHNHVKLLGEEKCRALLYWNAPTGCDTASSFCGRGKKTGRDACRCFPEFTEWFLRYLYKIQLFFLNSLLRVTCCSCVTFLFFNYKIRV